MCFTLNPTRECTGSIFQVAVAVAVACASVAIAHLAPVRRPLAAALADHQTSATIR
jgi:hypothetical protein